MYEVAWFMSGFATLYVVGRAVCWFVETLRFGKQTTCTTFLDEYRGGLHIRMMAITRPGKSIWLVKPVERTNKAVMNYLITVIYDAIDESQSSQYGAISYTLLTRFNEFAYRIFTGAAQGTKVKVWLFGPISGLECGACNSPYCQELSWHDENAAPAGSGDEAEKTAK